MTAMNRLNSRNCFMLFYYQIVTCLLVTCAAAADMGSACRCDCLCFPVKHSFSDMIMNEHLKHQWGYGVGRITQTKLNDSPETLVF